MKQLDSVNELRRKNLRALIDEHRSARTVAKMLGVDESRISHIMNQIRPLGEKAARMFEGKLKLPAGWFDEDHNTLREPPTLNSTLLSEILFALNGEIKDSQIDSAKKDFILQTVYTASLALGRLDRKLLSDLLNLAK